MKSSLIILIVVLVLPSITLAQLSGPLSGTIPTGTHSVIGNIGVSMGDTLIIEAGAELVFEDNYNFVIMGLLHAAGAVSDSIRFTNAPDSSWGGVFFIGTDLTDLSILDYCVVTGCSASALTLQNCDADITHSSIRHNTNAAGNGGGINCFSYSNPTFEHCVIENNSAAQSGGGIYSQNSEPLFSHCVIRNNISDADGGGVYLDQSLSDGPAVFESCEIRDNYAVSNGGGLGAYRASVDIMGCTISGNSCGIEGAAIYSNCGYGETKLARIERCVLTNNVGAGTICVQFNASAAITHCTLSNNVASYNAAIAFLVSEPSTIIDTIVEGTAGRGLYLDSQVAVRYSDFHANTVNFYGGHPGYGEIVDVNANGDPCDLFMNIFEPPLFVDPDNGDYNLLAGSACIDAGDPESPLDPDDTTADIGAFYFDHVSAAGQPSVPAIGPALAVYPNPFNPQTTVVFEITREQVVEVAVYDLLGRRVCILAEGFRIAGRHEVSWNGRDSLGYAISSGTYFISLETEGGVEAKKVMLIR